MNTVQHVDVVVSEKIGTISPYLHGQFAEHLGELIYPGIWVGEDSSIPNVNGLRKDVIDALKPLRLPVVRWPGGCFADGYHWRHGIGPREQRPKRINYYWGMAPEPNHFGTHEFIAFCRAIGTEPYITGNAGSGTPQELGDWVEYCNFAGDSSLSRERRANGADEPFGVKFWAVGNENWGCGGSMDPETYAATYARMRTYVFDYPGSTVHAIACGAGGNDWGWTRRVMDFWKNKHWNRLGMVQSLAAHYYCGTAGTATEYTSDQWLELLCKAAAIEGIITGHRAIMDEYDPKRNINLIVDEWGTWHPVEPDKPNSGLYQQNTMRDACVAALSLDIFNNHADIIYMANIAQLINVLQALLLVDGERCITTPTYHVYDLYQPHRNAQAVRFVSQAEAICDGGDAKEYCRAQYADNRELTLQAVQGSASVKNGVLCVTACNAHPSQPCELEIDLTGGKLADVEVTKLACDDIHAHNTFDTPNQVCLAKPEVVAARGNTLRVLFPAASVMRVMGKLG
ncbi:MAG: alpha-N-arabinofuranosidase [Chloroflexi bacterium]|nr:alpha-N-arabinofuranosidase [Chloroflexota bacterium]